MIRLFILFILAFVLTILVQIGLNKLWEYATGIKDEVEEDEDEAEWVEDILKPLTYYALRGAAIIWCAVLPALGKGGILMALTLGLILCVVIEVVSNLSNLQLVKHMGIKASIVWSAQLTISSLIVTAVSYYLAWFLLV